MCTVSWLRDEDGFHLLCNRDEKKTRLQALAPVVEERNGVQFLAPRDGDAGGAWISVNDFGLALCLLNGHGWPTAGGRSRGAVLLEWASLPTLLDVQARFLAAALDEVAAFEMAVLQPGHSTLVLSWDGRSKRVDEDGDARMPLTSSSWDADAAQAARQAALRRMGPLDYDSLLAFHRSHEAGDGPLNPCMHRDDAETVSFSRVQVDRSAVRLYYSPEAPCRHAAGAEWELARR